MAVAVTFGHSWASAVFYNFSVVKLADNETLDWPDLEYKKAWAEREKRLAVLSFDVHEDLCTILRKGKVDRLQSVSDIIGFAEDASNPAVFTLQFAIPEDPKKQKKFVEFERFEVWNRFDRQIIHELVTHATANSGSIKDLEDSFPKQYVNNAPLPLCDFWWSLDTASHWRTTATAIQDPAPLRASGQAEDQLRHEILRPGQVEALHL
jgi:hypothetical protein